MLITSPEDVLENMGWKENKKPSVKKQRELFIEFSTQEKVAAGILQTQELVHTEDLYFKSNLSSSAVAQALLMLEIQGIVSSLPGKIYRISS